MLLSKFSNKIFFIFFSLLSIKYKNYFLLKPINELVDILSFQIDKIKTLLTRIAVIKLTIIQIPNIKPNHLIIFTQKINKIIEIISPVILESHIADQELSNQICIDFFLSCFKLFLNSSFILSKIKILASIAIPIDKISPATEARVKIFQKDFITTSTKIT